MWPCNSIISAFVWFVTHGKWTQNFQCGCCRILFKVSYPCRFQSNSVPLDGIPEGTGELFPMRKRDTGALLDLGTVVVSLESSRLPGTGLWWNTLSAPEPRKPLPVKRSFSIILVCSLRLLCFPVGLSSPSVKMIHRPWEQQLPGMCLHSPEEEKWHHLECGPVFPIPFNSLPSQVLHGTPEERQSLLCSSPPQSMAAAAQQEL